MKQIILLNLILIPLLGLGQNNKTAEAYYDSAFKILNSNTYGALSKGLSSKALDLSNKAIQLDSNVSKYFRVKATSYYHLKNYEQALYNHERAILLDSTNCLAWMGAGVVFENTNRLELAERYYRKSLECDSNLIVSFPVFWAS
ncbi:MAG: hypothetical protein MUE96_09815 [Bacteroidia bacterium]|jgi:Tfp pilus assembly protein PilF|nr:hypothetical protein [Bacteroidia bacterium]